MLTWLVIVLLLLILGGGYGYRSGRISGGIFSGWIVILVVAFVIYLFVGGSHY